MRITETTVALAAFILSSAIIGKGVITEMKGPEVDVIPPEQVLLYRSGNVLNLAIQLPMINNASDYNDLVTDVRLHLTGVKPSFRLTEIASPVFNDNSLKRQQGHCEPTLRCQKFSKMAISQRAETFVTVPAGGAQTSYYSFELYCDGPSCKGFGDFKEAAETLKDRELSLTVWLDLRRDGHRRITCRTPEISAPYLILNGWLTLECKEKSAAEVSSGLPRSDPPPAARSAASRSAGRTAGRPELSFNE